jgi:uncharacterized protein GlcG (DUF336 family)
VTIAIEKARSAARFKPAAKVFQDMLAAGGEGLRVLGLSGAVPVQGGVRSRSTADRRLDRRVRWNQPARLAVRASAVS